MNRCMVNCRPLNVVAPLLLPLLTAALLLLSPASSPARQSPPSPPPLSASLSTRDPLRTSRLLERLRIGGRPTRLGERCSFFFAIDSRSTPLRVAIALRERKKKKGGGCCVCVCVCYKELMRSLSCVKDDKSERSVHNVTQARPHTRVHSDAHRCKSRKSRERKWRAHSLTNARNRQTKRAIFFFSIFSGEK